jgi:hypothetical protein
LVIAALVNVLVPSLVVARTTARFEATALLSSLVLGSDTRADTDGRAASRECCAASASTVGSSQTLTPNELDAVSVPDVFLAGRVRDVLATRQIRRSLDRGKCDYVRGMSVT